MHPSSLSARPRLRAAALLPVLGLLFLVPCTGARAQSYSVEALNKGSKYVVLCTRKAGAGWLEVARRLADHRHAASIVRFDVEKTGDLLPYLRKVRPENVAYVVPPELLTPHLAGNLAELSSRVRKDKFVDYASGYVTGITAADALALVERTIDLEKKQKGLPRFCSAVGHSWYRMTRGRYLMLFSRESGKGPKLRILRKSGKISVLEAAADAMIAESNPDLNYQRGIRRSSLMVALPDAARSLVRFEVSNENTVKKAVLELRVDASRWRLGTRMVLGASPIKGKWKEGTVTWNGAPDLDLKKAATVEVGPETRTLELDLTQIVGDIQRGVVLHCHGAGGKDDRNLLRHMYFIMQDRVKAGQEKGFEGRAVEALRGRDWKENALKKLSCIEKGGLILFGGHGSGSVSCLVGTRELERTHIGPSVVFNGTCFAAATHRIVKFAYADKTHSLMRTMPPKESFALIMLKQGSVGYFGGSGSCSFGHVNPGIELIRDKHYSLGRTIQAIHNHFIKPVRGETWKALPHRPGDPGFDRVNRDPGHPTMIQFTIRTLCIGDPAFVPYP